MEILKSAAAGTLESSDCLVTVEPGEGITLDLSSSVMNQYGRQIKAAVLETLERLGRTHRLFIVSNSQRGYPELCMEKLGIGPLFSGHLCFGDTGTCKGETIRRLMARHGIESACYIGDTQGDLDAAELAGIPFIYCAYGFGAVDHPWKTIDRFEDLLRL